MLYQNICAVSLGTYAFLSALSNGSTYYVQSAPSSDYKCPSNTTSCHIYCNLEIDGGNDNIYDCNDADNCYFHCDEKSCGATATINATNANNLYITQASDGQQCLESATITTPNDGNAYLSSNSKKGFKSMNLYAGANTKEIIINATNAKEDEKKHEEYKGMNIYAGTATYFSLTLANDIEWSEGFVECPINSSYTGPDIAPCMIDATDGEMTDITIAARDGIPKNVWISGCKTCKNVQIHCNNVDTLNGLNEYNTSIYPFNADTSDCWWTNNPTTDPTLAPTQPSINPTQAPSSAPSLPSSAPTQPPSKAPTQAPSVAPTQYPSLSPTQHPSLSPTLSPSAVTSHPTFAPSLAPTIAPTQSPSVAPTQPPSIAPTRSPSAAPSFSPSLHPTLAPSNAPTEPTLNPSNAATNAPFAAPTAAPTASPTVGDSVFVTLSKAILSDTLLIVFVAVIIAVSILICCFLAWFVKQHIKQKNKGSKKKTSIATRVEAVEITENQHLHRVKSDSFITEYDGRKETAGEFEEDEDKHTRKDIKVEEDEEKQTERGSGEKTPPKASIFEFCEQINDVHFDEKVSAVLTVEDEEESDSEDSDLEDSDSEDLYRKQQDDDKHNKTAGRISHENIKQQDDELIDDELGIHMHEPKKSILFDIVVDGDAGDLPQAGEVSGVVLDNRMLEEEKVIIWMRDEVGLPEYSDMLLRNGYDCMLIVADLTMEDLKEIGINKLGHARKIAKLAKKLNDTFID